MNLLAEIITANSFAEVMWLVAFILFMIEVVRLVAAGDRTWGYGWLIVVAGLAAMALGFLAWTTGD